APKNTPYSIKIYSIERLYTRYRDRTSHHGSRRRQRTPRAIRLRYTRMPAHTLSSAVGRRRRGPGVRRAAWCAYAGRLAVSGVVGVGAGAGGNMGAGAGG